MPPLSQPLRRLLYIGLPLLVLAAGVWWQTRPAPVKVRLAEVAEGTVEATVEATVANTRAGTIKACRRSKLSLHSGGRVAQLYVKEGDHVQKGQLLLRLEAADREAMLAQARAQVSAASERRQQACHAAQDEGLHAFDVDLHEVEPREVGEQAVQRARAHAHRGALRRCEALARGRRRRAVGRRRVRAQHDLAVVVRRRGRDDLDLAEARVLGRAREQHAIGGDRFDGDVTTLIKSGQEIEVCPADGVVNILR